MQRHNHADTGTSLFDDTEINDHCPKHYDDNDDGGSSIRPTSLQETMIATQCTFMLCGKGSQAYEKTRGASETKKSNNMGPGDGGGGGHLVGLQCSQYEEA